MILDISDAKFRRIFNDKCFYLPILWDGENFNRTLEELFEKYLANIKQEIDLDAEEYGVFFREIKQACNILTRAVRKYLNGYPACALHQFFEAMHILQKRELKIYQKSSDYEGDLYSDPLDLYRVVKVPDNKPYGRDRVFHTPFNMRAKVSTSRYSIAGFPSLYLGTSLQLCCEEIQTIPQEKFVLASLFKIDRKVENTRKNIRVIELGIKPQDFILEGNEDYIVRNERNGERNSNNRRKIEKYLLRNDGTRIAYLLWYPLIAACSFIRVNKKDPFAAEYIIPQLLMQWVRLEMSDMIDKRGEIIGIRYFSCASVRASEMGFNYVFPTYGEKRGERFCSVLRKAFWLTEPIYINEYERIEACEQELQNKQFEKV